MSDHCKQCSEKIFGQDYGDLKGLTSKADEKRGFYAFALCEGCGSIQVDSEGKCVSSDCYENHDGPHEDFYTLQEFEGALQVGAFNDEDGSAVLEDADGNRTAISCGRFNITRLKRLGYTRVLWISK